MSEIAGLPERIRFSAAADLALFLGPPGKEEPVNGTAFGRNLRRR